MERAYLSLEHKEKILESSKDTEIKAWKAISCIFIILSLLLAAELLYYNSGFYRVAIGYTQPQSSWRFDNYESTIQNLFNKKYFSPRIEDDTINQTLDISLLPSSDPLWQHLYIRTALEMYYDYVRAHSYSSSIGIVNELYWRAFPSYFDLSVSFAAKLASHDIGNYWWPTLEKASGYYNRTGEYSYETSNRIMELAIILSGISTSDSEVTKVEKVLAFINSYICYEDRILDHMLFPCETLTFRSGDCTSFSILAAAMLEKVSIKSAIAFFYNSTIGYHSMILVQLDNLGDHGYWYYEDLTNYGLASGKWIIIEPQCNSLKVQDEKLNNWIAYWDLITCAEVPGGL